MRLPQMENVYSTLSRQRTILNSLNHRIAMIKTQIGYRDVLNMSGGDNLDLYVNSTCCNFIFSNCMFKDR